MNKKIIALIIAIIIIIAIGLGIWLTNTKSDTKKSQENTQNTQENENINNTNNNEKENIEKKEEEKKTSDKKEAVIYFSASGTTRSVAKIISSETGADLIEIVPKEKYTDADLNWNDSNSRTSIECNDEKSRPAISNTIEVEKYDTIYLGYPIWWGTTNYGSRINAMA